MIKNVPDDWKLEKLENITEFLTCGVAKRPEYVDKDIGVPFLSSKNAKTNRMILDDYNCVSKEDYEVLTKYYKPQKGDILYTRVGSFGEAVVVNVDFDFAVFVSLTIMRAKPELVNNYYLSNILNSPFIKQIANEKARGIGVKNLNVSDVRNFDIPIPPLPQQEKIVKVLDISSALIEKQKELIEKYDLFLKSKFIEMFGDPISNPMGWEIVKFSKIANVKTTSIKADDINDEIYIALDSIEKDTGRLVKAYNSEEEDIKSNKYIFISSMLLYGKLRPYLNKVLLPNFDGICSTDILPVEPIKNFATKEYLAYYLRHSKIVELLSNSVSGANLPRVSPKILKDLDIQKIPLDLQNKFTSIVKKTEQVKEQESKKLEHLQTLHNSLMDKAFKGEIE